MKTMTTHAPTPKLKLTLKKETLRILVDRDLRLLDTVMGGTDGGGGGGGCDMSNCMQTIIY